MAPLPNGGRTGRLKAGQKRSRSGGARTNLREVRYACGVHIILLQGCIYGENLIILTIFSYFRGCGRTQCQLHRASPKALAN